MRINNITNNCFEGKILLSSFVKPNEKNFLDEILNYKIDGISNEEFLRGKKFDLNVWSNKQTIHPKIKMSSVINYIITGGYCKGQKNQNYNPLEIRIEDGIEKSAMAFRQHLADTENYIEQNYPTHYYGKRECFKQRMRVLFGKV